MRRVTVLACGEAMRGDDAVGLMAVAALAPEVAALAEIREVGQLSPDELLDAPEPVIVVDAVSGPPAGELIELPLAELAERGLGGTSMSSHALPLATAVALSVRLRGRAPEGRFIGLAGAHYGLDNHLSEPVRGGLSAFIAAIESAIRELAQD